MTRPPLHEILLRFAEHLAERSTCERLRVGAVVTSSDMMQVLGYGYNGNAAGEPNTCESPLPGLCGCLHAEINALLKAPGLTREKKLFVSTAPCATCAKAIVNARVSVVYFRGLYRLRDGLDLLARRGVRILQVLDGGELIDVRERGPGS